MTTKAKVTKEGLLIPREVAERALGRNLEVVIREEPGRLVVAAVENPAERAAPEIHGAEDPIASLGKSPVRTGARDGSANYDRYLYVDE